jgi:hypothetical protein
MAFFEHVNTLARWLLPRAMLSSCSLACAFIMNIHACAQPESATF